MQPSAEVIWTEESLGRVLKPHPCRLGPAPLSIHRVDVRFLECSPGSLFVPAIIDLSITQRPAEREAAQLKSAFRRGATVALTSLDPTTIGLKGPVIHVPDVKAALHALAKAARERFRGRVVAVTGSVGKTTTKDMIHHVLSRFGAARATFENHAGVADLDATMASLPASFDYATLEVASYEPGRIAFRAPTLMPNIGVVTNVGLSHAQNYAEPYEILREKASLLDYVDGDRIGIVHRSVLDIDDARERLIRAKRLSHLVTVGPRRDDDVHIVELSATGGMVQGTMSVFGSQQRFRLPVQARHFAENAMFAAATAHVLALNVAEALATLADFALSPQRMERWRVQIGDGMIEVIDDCYNAAPASVQALLQYLTERQPPGRKVLVLGDMCELGPDEERLHEELAPDITRAGIGQLLTVGPLARRIAARLSGTVDVCSFDDTQCASRAVPGLLQAGDLVAVKASRALTLEKVVEAIASSGSAAHAPVDWCIENEQLERARPA